MLKSILISIMLAYSICQLSVIDLTEDNLENFMKTQPMGFIEFYSPGCLHCQSVEPVYEEAAKLVKERGLDVVFSRINANKYPKVMSTYEIEETPTIIWFDNSHGQVVPYGGDTEMASSFLTYIEKQQNYKTPKVNLQEFKDLMMNKNITSKNVLVVYGDKDSDKKLEYFNHITNSAWNVEIGEIYWTDDLEFAKNYKLPTNNSDENYPLTSLIFKVREDSKVDLHNFELIRISKEDLDAPKDIKISSTNFKVENIMRLYSNEAVNIFTASTEKLIILAIPTLIVYHDFKLRSSEYDQMINNIYSVARMYRNEVFFLYGSPQTKFTKIFVESYRINKSELPLLCFSSPSTTQKYVIEKYRKNITKNTPPSVLEMVDMIEDWKSSKLQPYISSEPIPRIEADEVGIVKVVGDTYQKWITLKNKDVVLLLCSEKLELCQKFREIYTRVVKILNKNENLMFTEVDPYTNEIDFTAFDLYPSVVIFPDNGNKPQEYKEYKGKLTTGEIVKFIKANVKHAITEESSLSLADEAALKNEELSEIKPVNLEKAGEARKLYDQVSDVEQRDLYYSIDKTVVETEQKYLIQKLDSLGTKKLRVLAEDL